GYERDHFDVSRACAERVLLPAIRDAAPQTLLVASGFSCRSQIEQLGDAKALHVAQVLRLARGHAAPVDKRAATSFVTAPSGSYHGPGVRSGPVRWSGRLFVARLAFVGSVVRRVVVVLVVLRLAVPRFAVLRFAVQRFAVERFAVLRLAVERFAVV